MLVKVKKLAENAVIPKYAHDTDAGLDLVVSEIKWLPGRQIEYNSNLAFEIPEGYVGLLFPRSSVRKLGIIMTNCVGVIDSGYRGPVKAVFQAGATGAESYQIGDRFAQLIVMPYPKVELEETDSLSDSDCGTGGYGSTGR